ncbi:MAG: NUDIX domain-containing protein [Verrucomicrobiia bacterium]
MSTRIRTAGVLMAGDQILLESAQDVDIWMVPGGGLKPQETLEEGCAREYHEETGLEVTCGRLICVHEHYWRLGRSVVREYGFYFEVHPLLPFDDPRPVIAAREAGMQFSWFPLSELGGLPFDPEHLRAVLAEMPTGTVFVSTKEEGVRKGQSGSA